MFGELEALIFHKLEICFHSRIVELYEENALIWISLSPRYPKMCLSVLNELFVALKSISKLIFKKIMCSTNQISNHLYVCFLYTKRLISVTCLQSNVSKASNLQLSQCCLMSPWTPITKKKIHKINHKWVHSGRPYLNLATDF